jgi:hypothetical protein
MKYLLEAIVVLPLTIFTAWWHHQLINDNRKIQHGWWALLFSAILSGVMWWHWQDLQPDWYWFALACLIGRLVVFNISLNLFRHYSAFYISPSTTSILDKIEQRIFGQKVWVLEAMLTLVFITLQFFI